MHIPFADEISIFAEGCEEIAGLLNYFIQLWLSHLLNLHPSLLIRVIYSNALVRYFNFEKNATK